MCNNNCMDKYTRNFGGILLAALVFCGCTAGRSRFANPFIGTDYTGHTSPAASCPLGMVQPGPHTGNYLWKYCSGYNYADSLILGFTQNRLSGTGVPSLCNVLIMPFSGNAGPGFASAKAGEKAKWIFRTTAPTWRSPARRGWPAIRWPLTRRSASCS